MTNGQPTGPDSPMEDTGGVSGMVNLTINLPDNLRLITVDSDEEEETEVASAIVTGSIIAFAGGTAPTGWLLCNGAAISRATYADLFAVIGTDYGVGNANTTFNLPDFRGRVMLGVDNMGQVSADRVTAVEADRLGGTGGSEQELLTIDHMPGHSHPVLWTGKSSPGDEPGETQLITNDSDATRAKRFLTQAFGNRSYPQYSHGLNQRDDETIPANSNPPQQTSSATPFLWPIGGDMPHNNMPPWQTVNYIIRT